MKILVRDISDSAYIFDEWLSWTEPTDCKEILHLGLRCEHDYVEIDEDGTAWCPTCKNADMTDYDADLALDNKVTEQLERIYDHE